MIPWITCYLYIVVPNTSYCVVFLRCFSSSCVPYIAIFSALSIVDYPFGTDPGSFKLTDISYRSRFSFASCACIVRSFSVRLHFVRVIGSFVS